jgi:predicted RNase H-like nuclease (RuvC/YqgF family)
MSYQRKVQDYETTINRDLQTKIKFLSTENEELKNKINHLTGEVNKIPEFESKFTKVYTEVERLNNILRSKNEEVATLGSRYRTSEE